MARRRFEGDPVDALRRGDPIHRLEVPTDTSGAHARALFQEVTEMDTMERTTGSARLPVWRRVTLAASAAAVAVVAVAAFAILDDGEEAIVGAEPIGGGAAASCLEMYDLTVIADRDVAFDGTLITTDGNNATFAVNRWFKGGEGDTITLGAEGLISDESVALLGVSLQIGERYLVSGSDGFVWACGFTMTYDTATADQWAEIFSN